MGSVSKKSPKKPAKLSVSIHNLHPVTVKKKQLSDVAKTVWQNEAVGDGRVDIILVDDDFICHLNKTFLAENQPTDVIAFPIEQNGGAFEGEVYISLERVAENAAAFAVPFQDELCRMVAHALLHFLGYDDHTRAGKKRMTERENYYLENYRRRE